MNARRMDCDPSSEVQRDIARIGCDAVYFLMFDGWKQELRSNRWHYATRWAHHRPVVLVQPHHHITTKTVCEEPAPGIPNGSILWIRQADTPQSYWGRSLEQAAELANHMRRHGYARPLLWLYNPRLAGLYAATPAVARLYHATENYFDDEGTPEFFYNQMEAALRASDMVVAVSEGVARGIRERVAGVGVEVVTNGCDYAAYRNGSRDNTFSKDKEGFARLAVYAGNINARLDFELLLECSTAFPDTKFTFYGPVIGLPESDMALWRLLLARPNVAYRGAVDPDRLPDLYASADVGVIPYKPTRVLVENGFPLKALEMGATGLPVVSTLMKPIVGLAAAIRVVDTTGAFLSALATTDRARLSAAEREELDQVSRMHDYDEKFRMIVRSTATKVDASPKLSTRMDRLNATDILGPWCEFMKSYHEQATTNVLRYVFAASVIMIHRSLPKPIRARIPASLRAFLRPRRDWR